MMDQAVSAGDKKRDVADAPAKAPTRSAFGAFARPQVRRRVLAIAATLIGLALTATFFLTLNKRFFFATIGYDEEFFVWGGWCINRGLAPYKDFLEFKPPMVFITHAIAFALYGIKDQAYRVFFTAFPLVGVLALQLSLVARGIGKTLTLALTLAIVFLFVNPKYHDTALTDAEAIGFSYYLIGLALLLWEGRYWKISTTLGTSFMCLAILSKEPFLPGVFFSWLGVLWLRGRGVTLESAKQYLKLSVIGGLLVALGLCLYMVPTGSMKAYITMVRGYSRIYRDPQGGYCVLLGIAHPSTPMGEAKVAWDKIRTHFFNDANLGYVLPLVAPGALFALRRSRGLFALMVLAALGGLWAPTATNCMWVHYYTMSLTGLVFVCVASADSMKGAIRGAEPAIRWGAGIAGLLVVAAHVWPTFELEWNASYRRMPWQEPQPGILAFIAQHTTREDRIFTSGPPVLYAQADRISAVRETNIIDEILGSYEGNTDEERLSHVREQLEKNMPKVVFMDPEHAERKHRHNSVLIQPFLNAHGYQKINDHLYLRP